MNRPFISIITVSYNSTEFTNDFLKSCLKLTYPFYELIIVDNASKPRLKVDIPEALNEKTTIIHLEENLGFGGGNNRAIEIAKGDFLFLVNNDTELTPDILENLLLPFENDSQIGVVSPKILFFDYPDKVQYAGFTPVHLLTGRNQLIGFDQPDSDALSVASYTSCAHGAAMMLKKEVVEKTGMFYEPFFLYYEELDWSTRILKAGFKIFYQPKARIFHKISRSIGKNNPLKTYYLVRNRILYMKRNVQNWQFALFGLFYLFISLPKSMALSIFKGNKDQFRAILRGTFEGFKMQASSEHILQ